MSKACRYGYLPTDFHSLEDLLDSNDESLFTSMRYIPQHVLHQLLPPPKHTGYNLRSRGHGLTLFVIPSEFMRKTFRDSGVGCSINNIFIGCILYADDIIVLSATVSGLQC